MVFRKLIKSTFKSLQPILGKFYQLQTARKRTYTYKGIKVAVYPGVFHPQFTLSTKFFVHHIMNLQLTGKKVLELGCGSGLISFHAASLGAQVTASDINSQSLQSILESMQINNLTVEPVLSDLFDKLDPDNFDYIFINPPYYPKNPASDQEKAWYCGEDFGYFEKLFGQVNCTSAEVLMVLSEDCQVDKIRSIAEQKGLVLHEVNRKQYLTELNWIFKISTASENTSTE